MRWHHRQAQPALSGLCLRAFSTVCTSSNRCTEIRRHGGAPAPQGAFHRGGGERSRPVDRVCRELAMATRRIHQVQPGPEST